MPSLKLTMLQRARIARSKERALSLKKHANTVSIPQGQRVETMSYSGLVPTCPCRCCQCKKVSKCLHCSCVKDCLSCLRCLPGDNGNCHNCLPRGPLTCAFPTSTVKSTPLASLVSHGQSVVGASASHPTFCTSSICQTSSFTLRDLPPFILTTQSYILTLQHVPKGDRDHWARVLTDSLLEILDDLADLSHWTNVFMLAKYVLASPAMGCRLLWREILKLVKSHLQKWQAGERTTLWSDAVVGGDSLSKREREASASSPPSGNATSKEQGWLFKMANIVKPSKFLLLMAWLNPPLRFCRKWCRSTPKPFLPPLLWSSLSPSYTL